MKDTNQEPLGTRDFTLEIVPGSWRIRASLPWYRRMLKLMIGRAYVRKLKSRSFTYNRTP